MPSTTQWVIVNLRYHSSRWNGNMTMSSTKGKSNRQIHWVANPHAATRRPSASSRNESSADRASHLRMRVFACLEGQLSLTLSLHVVSKDMREGFCEAVERFESRRATLEH